MESSWATGDGTFQARLRFAGGGGSLAVADLNGDGAPDIVTAVRLADGVSVLLHRRMAGLGASPDSDMDGCSDAHELGFNPRFGGLRDPADFWDFFDPNRDRGVGFQDFLAVLRHFGAVRVPPPTKAEALAEALLPEPPVGEYWALADRGGQAPGGDPWDELPANGSITFADFLSVLRQFGHTCE